MLTVAWLFVTFTAPLHQQQHYTHHVLVESASGSPLRRCSACPVPSHVVSSHLLRVRLPPSNALPRGW